MLNDEDLPRAPVQLIPKPSLDRLGVAELQGYIAGLEAEIGRARAEIGRKQAMLDVAHGFFRTS